VKQIRKHITYANVMSSIAVFLVLGGGAAYAAKKIGSNEIKGNSITTGKIKKEAVSASKIKKNAITTAKIANGAVTGAKLNLGSVGTVPNAAHANTADNANNANTVGGQSVLRIFGQVPAGTTTQQTIATFAGFTLTSNCEGTFPDINLVSPAGIATDMKAQGNGIGGGAFVSTPQGNGPQTLTLDRSGATNNVRGETSFSAALTNGTVVSGEIGYDDSNSFATNPTCAIYGHVTVG
jgi:hypothetical protein